MRRRFAAVLLGVLVVLVGVAIFPSRAVAQENPPTDDEVNAIAKGLYCPVCENVPLDVCPTLACKQWRDTIREKLALGWTKAQIEQYFVEQYGDRVLAAPPPHGLNWAVYLIPPAAFLVGVAVLVGAMRAWRRPPIQPRQTEQPTIEDPYLRRVEQELQERA